MAELEEVIDWGSREIYHRNKDSQAREGSYKRYHHNGVVAVEATYANGEFEGEYKSYYDNGQVKEESVYDKGALSGEQRKYNEFGTVTEISAYKNGNKTVIDRADLVLEVLEDSDLTNGQKAAKIKKIFMSNA